MTLGTSALASGCCWGSGPVADGAHQVLTPHWPLGLLRKVWGSTCQHAHAPTTGSSGLGYQRGSGPAFQNNFKGSNNSENKLAPARSWETKNLGEQKVKCECASLTVSSLLGPQGRYRMWHNSGSAIYRELGGNATP